MPSFASHPDPNGSARKLHHTDSTANDDAPANTKRATATRVVKKLAPTQAGALKLARRYGAALVCVRHRHDLKGEIRFTTVELVVEQVPIGKMRQPATTRLVNIHVARTEYELKRRIRAHGGVWDPDTYAWVLPRPVAKQLGLLGRVIKTLP